jgi:hypothetical protein
MPGRDHAGPRSCRDRLRSLQAHSRKIHEEQARKGGPNRRGPPSAPRVCRGSAPGTNGRTSRYGSRWCRGREGSRRAGIAVVRRARAATIESRADEPVRSMARRIDEGEAALGGRFAPNDGEHVARSVRKLSEGLTIGRHGLIHLATPQRDQPRRRMSRLPAQSAGRPRHGVRTRRPGAPSRQCHPDES